jgi:hypothetical protein
LGNSRGKQSAAPCHQRPKILYVDKINHKAGKLKPQCQFIEFCYNIEEIQIDGLCSDTQLTQDLAKMQLPAWIIPKGALTFNPNHRCQVTLKNVTHLQMNPVHESNFSFACKDIFSQNLYR